MSEKIDTRISDTLNPQYYVETDGYQEQKQFVGCVANAASYIYQALEQVHTARALTDNNGAWTENMKVVEVGKMAAKHKELVNKKLEQTRRDLNANVAHVEAQLMEPLVERANLGNLNAEVRDFMRNLKGSSEREKFMREALKNNDDATLEAVLGAQHFLSGMTAIDRDFWLREYHTRKRPDLVRRLDVLRSFGAKLDIMERAVTPAFEKAIGDTFPNVAALQRMDELARAALAAEPRV